MAYIANHWLINFSMMVWSVELRPAGHSPPLASIGQLMAHTVNNLLIKFSMIGLVAQVGGPAGHKLPSLGVNRIMNGSIFQLMALFVDELHFQLIHVIFLFGQPARQPAR